MIFRLISLFLLFVPIRKKTVLFNSFKGQYCDSPKYVSQELHRLFPEYRILWVKDDSVAKDDFPPYVKVVKQMSLPFLYWRCAAQVVIDNVLGLRSGQHLKTEKLKCFFVKCLSYNKKGQLTLSTWHGTPLKHIGADEPNADLRSFYPGVSYILSGSKYGSQCLTSSNYGKVSVLEYGTPRNDVFFKNKINIQQVKSKLGLPLDKAVVLFAPTFRDNVELSGKMQLENIDFQLLLQTLKNKFKKDFIFVFRLHYHVLKSVNIDNLKAKVGGNIIFNGNLHDDMAEYLMCTDVLLTDYSSSFFDFSLTKKPVFLYVPDIEHYASQERGFYLPLDSLPFPSSKSFEGLISNIEAFDGKKYEKNIDYFLTKIGNVEDGNATQRVVSFIHNYIK